MTDAVTPPSRLRLVRLMSAAIYAFVAAAIMVSTTQVRWGERLDARAAASMGSHAHGWMHRIDGITVPLMCLMGFVAAVGVVIQAMRGRRDLACRAVILVAGTQTSTEVLKHVIHRQDGAGNTSPSGHTALALSLALTATALWPQRLIRLAVLAMAAFVAYGTVIGGWHTPGDVVTACAITGFWSILALGSVGRRVPTVVDSLPVAGGMLLAAAGLHPKQAHAVSALAAFLTIFAFLGHLFAGGVERKCTLLARETNA